MLLDTDVLIDLQRDYPPAREWFSLLSAPPEVPGFVVMELVQNSNSAREVRATRSLIALLPVVWPDADSCDAAVEAYSRLHLSHGLGLIDALIAATAVFRGAPLVTHNAKHYGAYPGLTILRPYDK